MEPGEHSSSAELEAEEAMIELARENFEFFCEYVMKDERSGLPITLAPMHRAWIRVLNENNRRTLIWSSVRSGKTTLLTIANAAWRLGRNPNLRIMIASNVLGIASKILGLISSLITENEDYRRVFPHIKPALNASWTSTEITVRRRPGIKDPSVRAVGAGVSIVSARVDYLICDDILDMDNTHTEASRDLIKTWFELIATGRLEDDASVLLVGTAYHPKDLYHVLAENDPTIRAVRFPILNRKGESNWPERWSPEVIERTKIEMQPVNFARNCLCRARADESAEFKQAWIDAALNRGRGMTMIRSLREIPRGTHIFVGVDLAASKKHRSDQTIFFTFAQDDTGARRLLNIEAGKWDFPEIRARFISHGERYDPDFAIETNAAQSYVFQQLRATTKLRVFSHTTTGTLKQDPVYGVLGLADELDRGDWIFPSSKNGKAVDPELIRFIAEMLFFNPKGHTGDRLMACWFGRERARLRLGGIRHGGGDVRIIGGRGDETVREDESGEGTADEAPAEGTFARLFADRPEAPEPVYSEWDLREQRRHGYRPPPSSKIPASVSSEASTEKGVLFRLFSDIKDEDK